MSLGELKPVSLGELQPLSLGELQPVSLGELQPVSLGELQPVSLLLHLLCLQWCKNAGPGSCQFFNLKQSSVLLAFHKGPVFRLCMQYLPAFEEDDAEWKNYPSATSCSYQCSKYIYFACVFVCICQRAHLFSKQQHLCVSWTNIRKKTFQREREAKHKYTHVLRYTTVFLSEPPLHPLLPTSSPLLSSSLSLSLSSNNGGGVGVWSTVSSYSLKYCDSLLYSWLTGHKTPSLEPWCMCAFWSCWTSLGSTNIDCGCIVQARL